jgi:hypothetical protein
VDSPWRHALVDLPSVVSALSSIRDTLAAGRSTIVLVPHAISLGGVPERLLELLEDRGLQVAEVYVDSRTPPLLSVVDALGLGQREGSRGLSAEEMLAADPLVDVVLLRGVEGLETRALHGWFALLSAWTREAKSVAGMGRKPTALCAFAPADPSLEALPEPDVHLQIQWWWGIPSIVELRLLGRIHAPASNSAHVGLWREHVIPSLSGNDTDLFTQLWLADTDDMAILLGMVRSFGDRFGWAPERLRELGATELLAPQQQAMTRQCASPPAPWRSLWANGGLQWSVEHGLEAHPSALACLGLDSHLNHRIWRGQARLLLPLLDELRLAICRELTDRLGPEWPVRWAEPIKIHAREAVRESPLACDWGHLHYLLSNFIGIDEARTWRSLVGVARGMRNRLAHQGTVTLGDYSALRRQMAHEQ